MDVFRLTVTTENNDFPSFENWGEFNDPQVFT